MMQLVLKFASCTRAAGLRVSTSEVLDCLDQLQHVNPVDEEEFKILMRANFAKSRRDQAKFDYLYDLFFHEMQTDLDFKSESMGQYLQEILKMLGENLPQDQESQAVLDLMAGNPMAYLELLQQIQSDDNAAPGIKGSNLGQLAKRLQIMLGFNDVRELIAQFLEGRTPSPGVTETIDYQIRQQLRAYFDERLEVARELLTSESRPNNESLKTSSSHDKHLAQLGDKPFVSLNRKEVEEMREIINHLVAKLKDTIGRRYARKTSGILDVKKTLRQSSKYQGVPVELVYKTKQPKKGKIVTICDVSGSVWSAARFMLNLLYSVSERFNGVRSFIFVNNLAEVSDTFDKYEINQAIENVLRNHEVEFQARTDYGAMLRHFRREYMDILNKKTTLIIIGDGRSNYSNPEADILDQMRDKCRRVIWLNPEAEVFWYSGDSEMRTYERYCHEFRQVQNLNQLMEFIKDLVL
ncbi:MAG: VWA domain-containing protein [Desulfatibacillum sp.]|nr:VWA domain-containing protein [Desulfatibacillum sp.]